MAKGDSPFPGGDGVAPAPPSPTQASEPPASRGDGGGPRLLEPVFRFIIAKRWWVVLVYALLLPISAHFALRIEQDNSLDRLIVESDPDAVAARAFEQVFGSGEYVVVLAEAPDPFAPSALERIDAIERALARVPGIESSSALSVFRRSRVGFEATPDQAASFKHFALGTSLFRKQGLVGEGFLALPVILRAADPAEQGRLLAQVDAAIASVAREPAPLTALRKVGGPYVNRYLDESTARATRRYFPIFGLLLFGLNLALYRSFRTLAAFVATLAVAVALTLGYIGATGGVLTIVSPLVPMTILVTCTATLVYIHSRFVEHPAGIPVREHLVFALVNKFTACTLSLFATAAGFAALTVSRIRPIRDLGLWTALGMLATWIVVFTLFPALQSLLRTPTHERRRTAGGEWLQRLSAWVPRFSFRWRWTLVVSALVLCGAGGVAIFGFPGVLPPMRLETDGLEYVNHRSALYQDTKRLESVIAGLSLTEVWLAGDAAILTDPRVLRGLDRFQEALAREPGVGSVAGPTTILRMLRYLGGGDDRLPDDPAALGKLATDLEMLRPTEPALAGFVDASLSQTHLAVISRSVDYAGFEQLSRRIAERWREAVLQEPALATFTLRTVGSGPLQAKIAHHLVPTLVESFALTVGIIFLAFLLVFRSGPARLMAMIPSLFAILVMFAVMRVTGMTLNVATILIASTVLGTSENDQIHFFYHFLEKRRTGSAEESLTHTLRIAGKAIFYATLINAGGFLAFAFADLPPMRQFGILTALAFLLSMLADFTALPAALWLIYGESPSRPEASEAAPSS